MPLLALADPVIEAADVRYWHLADIADQQSRLVQMIEEKAAEKVKQLEERCDNGMD